MRKINILTCILLLCFFSPSDAAAQSQNAEGIFKSEDAELLIILLNLEKGIVAARSSIVQGACSGSIAGLGTAKGHTIMLSAYPKEEQDKGCEIKIVFNKKWSSAKLYENEYCALYHGAACGWEGQVVTRSSRK